MLNELANIISNSIDRYSLSIEIINHFKFTEIAEIGVLRGNFAFQILSSCPLVINYYMIDPWRNLDDWNKPANKDNSTFEKIYKEALSKTEFASSKRKILRGKTVEVIDKIENESLDFIYIDGDHTLKGITIDLINCWNKIRENGFIIGDDFCPSIWQHKRSYEPTLVFPFAVYFAEAMKANIYGLPFNQFLIVKEKSGFNFMNFTNADYQNTNLLQQLSGDRAL
jgi:hypothetical protein